jgi:hypothetical protein
MVDIDRVQADKLKTVHGTVLEHQIKNIIGTTHGKIFRTIHYQE